MKKKKIIKKSLDVIKIFIEKLSTKVIFHHKILDFDLKIKNIAKKFANFKKMKNKHKKSLINIFNKEIIRGLKSDKHLPEEIKLNLKVKLEKFNKKQNKIIDLIINLKHLDYIELCLKNSKSKKFNKEILKEKIIEKYKNSYQILQKAKNPCLKLKEFLESLNLYDYKLSKDSFFKTTVLFSNKKDLKGNFSKKNKLNDKKISFSKNGKNSRKKSFLKKSKNYNSNDILKNINNSKKNNFLKKSKNFKSSFVQFKNMEEDLEIEGHYIWDRIKGYLNQDFKFEIELERNFVMGIIYLAVKEEDL